MSNYLIQYRDAIRRKEIIAGVELITELDNLINDLDDERYIYDTTDAEIRIDFMENCIKLTKSPFYGKPMKLMLWQKAFIEVLYSFKMRDITFTDVNGNIKHADRFQRALLMIGRKNTKALALDTRIPTPSGDRTIGDIKQGDYVFNEQGKPVKVLGTSEIFKDRKCYEITFEDGEKIICDENHKWTVQTKNTRRRAAYIPTSNRKGRAQHKLDDYACITLQTFEMVNDFVRIRADGKGNEYKYRVPISQPLEYPERELFSPYILGLWLGDGDKKDNRIACGKDDLQTLIENIKRENIEVLSVKEFGGKYEVRIGTHTSHRNNVRDALRALGVWKDKHIPEEYFTASVEQRYELLKGLMDTDGMCSKSGQCSFSQKSKRMTDDVSRLLSSLGIKHSVIARKAICNGKLCDYFGITFWVDKAHTCFKYERKTSRLKEKLAPRMLYKSIIDIKEVENRDTKCICVDNPRGLFVCGERNTVTHNSELTSALILTESIIGNEGADLVCSSNDDIQASILYDAIDVMRTLIDPEQIDTGRNQRFIKINVNNSKIFKLSDRTRNKEGRNIDYAAVDEIHEMKDNTIIKSIEQSQSLKDNPKLIMITTEGFVNDGALDELLRDARKTINGENDDIAAERFLPWLYTQDSEQEIWQNEKSWEKSNPSLGVVKKWDYLRTQIAAARKSTADRIFVLSKDFNFKQNSVKSWLNIEDYAYQAVYDIDDFRGAIGLGGVDMSETTDMTSAKILLMRKGDKSKYILSHYFIPESKLTDSDDKEAGAKYKEWVQAGLLTICEGNDIDLTLVADWFFKVYKEYKIKVYKCGYDVKFSKEFLKRMDEYGFDTEIVIQNKLTLSNAVKLCEADFKQQLINYNQNEVDAWCFGNAALDVDNLGNCQVVKKIPSKRIDGAVTLTIAYEMYRRYRSDFVKMLKG